MEEILPAYAPGQPEVTIRRITIPAGVRLEMHRHPVINAGVMLSGQLTVVTVEGKTLHLKAGDPIVEVVNTLHYGINEGKVPAGTCRLLCRHREHANHRSQAALTASSNFSSGSRPERFRLRQAEF